jgi:regulator of protease activity HflC (stomatin/prohibitin superfamily)
MKKIMKFLAVIMITLSTFLITGCTRVGPGYEGLKVALAGGDKGTAKIEPTYGWTPYFPGTTQVVKVYVRNQHFITDEITVQAKGGTNVEVHPSFNYRVTPGKVDSLYLMWGITDDQQIQGKLLETSLLTTLRELTNSYTIDSLLNNRASYDVALEMEMNKKLTPYVTISQLTSGVKPDKAMADAIAEKSTSIQKAIAAENKKRETNALNDLDLMNARKDSAVAVIAASGKAEAIRKEQLFLTPLYVEYTKWIKADPNVARVPQYVGGNGYLFNGSTPTK